MPITEQVVQATVTETALTGVVTDQVIQTTITAGVTDHGLLTGLADDDHPQYSPIAHVHAGTSVVTKTAGETLGGHRAVWVDTDDQVYYADALAVSADRAVGLTTGAAAAAAAATIQTGGELVEPAWAWTPGPVWLSAAGALTQTPPASGRLTQLGVATAPTKVFVRVEPAIQL